MGKEKGKKEKNKLMCRCASQSYFLKFVYIAHLLNEHRDYRKIKKGKGKVAHVQMCFTPYFLKLTP